MQSILTQDDQSFRLKVMEELEKSDDRMLDLMGKVTKLEAEHQELKAVLNKNTESVGTIVTNTQELLGVFESWKGAMRVLEMIGRAAKPLGYIASFVAACVAGWMALKNGGGPLR